MNNKGQNAIEYMLIFGLVVALILIAFGPDGMLSRSIEDSLEIAIGAIECTAETACFDPTVCNPVCGNGCCEPGEEVGGAFECGPDCGGPCVANPDPCNGIDCGPVDNGCGVQVSCPDTCISPETCDPPTNTCLPCVPDPSACNGVDCGNVDNGCGVQTLCPDTCPPLGLVCNVPTNTCQCIANPDPCNGIDCGNVDNGCGTMVPCPDTCSAPDVCDWPNSNNCICVPNPTPCAGVECGNVDDGCRTSVLCIDTCILPDVCDVPSNTCVCVPIDPCLIPGNCGIQPDGCGGFPDCGPTCPCYSFATPSGACGARPACPGGITATNADTFSCTIGQECEAPNGPSCAIYRCDPVCSGCAIPQWTFPYPCMDPVWPFWRWTFQCGQPNDLCDNPIFGVNCGPCAGTCTYLDPQHSVCLATVWTFTGTQAYTNNTTCPAPLPPAGQPCSPIAATCIHSVSSIYGDFDILYTCT